MDDALFQAPHKDEPLEARFAQVAPDRGIDRPEPLTYLIPQQLSNLQVGDRVSVPLGRGERAVPGTIVSIVDHTDVPRAKLKPITGALGAQLPTSLVELGQWLAQYYCCPPGMVFQTMVPAAVTKAIGRKRRIVLDLSELGRRVIAGDAEPKLPASAKNAWGALVARQGLLPSEPKTLRNALELASVAPLSRLEREGLLEKRELVAVRATGGSSLMVADPDHAEAPDLMAEQQRAVDAVSKTLGSFAPFLLFGVTGSGKTEVYLALLQQVLARGQSAIVLVPEISLTPQTLARFAARLGGEQIAVLHSGLTASQRHAEWQRIARGEARIVIGARSAVFAPATKLGIIVVDEEHDSSYKQDQLPRYHGRDVALKRAQLEACPVVLGTATPSLESWHNAETGKFQLLELPTRAGGGVLPKVDIVDLIEERRASAKERQLRAIGPTLHRAIERALGAGGQVMLLLNRRGYASYIGCADARCGWTMPCDYCDANMVYHRRNLPSADGSKRTLGHVKCHHCEAMNQLPALCPQCGRKISLLGFGTQRLEEELAREFPEALIEGQTMLRLDSDTMQHARDYQQALDRFRAGEIRLLLGTQMIAKGLDFPNVQLVGVVNADTALSLPDFRAPERTFQLVAQVAGRAGRSVRAGAVARVIVQSADPTSPAITFAAKHDYRGFAKQELAVRARAHLPPMGRMARLVFRDKAIEKAEASAWAAKRALDGANIAHLTWRGPFPAPISRVGGYHRIALELLAPKAGVVQQALTMLRNQGLAKSDAHCAVDVDPVALM
ncbi:MAG: primosomal protein N' [Phycisphaerales bacterium]|nr:primosomal protein N' [Phycisphaerales bacterium]